MKFLTILGGLVGILTIILGLANIYDTWGPLSNTPIVGPLVDRTVERIIIAIIGLIICAITLAAGLKPDDPIPWHWLVLFILAILMVVFGALWGALLVIIAALIGLIDDL